MRRMQMWWATGDTSDPIVKVGDDGYWITRLGGDEYLVTRVSDSRKVGTFRDGTHPPDTDPLLEEIALAARNKFRL
jgi:hypothetical protein